MIRGLLACILALSLPLAAQDPPPPDLDGLITALPSSLTPDINGKHVLLTPTTEIKVRNGDRTSPASPADRTFYLGEHLQIFGKLKSHILEATRIVILPAQPAEVTARGIVEAVLPATTSVTLLRAAGYKLLLPASLSVTFLPAGSPNKPLQTNLWIAFHGKQQPDGIILADKVIAFENTIGKSEQKLIDKTDYDPTAIDPDTGQTLLSKAFLGIDPHKIPPYEDHAMQLRLTAIGERLIPAYQRALPTTDPTKINFRFQLIDQGSWRQPLTLGSGIILVPFQIVDRMQNDSQLATLLANSIAVSLEKQAIDTQVSVKMLAATLGLETAGVLCAPIAIGDLALQAALVPAAISNAKAARLQDEERLRVSLFLLDDAGFDIYQAPHAWWLLSSKKKDLSQIPLPRRAAYLYQVLGTAWHTRSMTNTVSTTQP